MHLTIVEQSVANRETQGHVDIYTGVIIIYLATVELKKYKSIYVTE